MKLNSCSWFKRRSLDLVLQCNAQCTLDCKKVDEGSELSISLANILQLNPGYCTPALPNDCFEQCNLPFVNQGANPPAAAAWTQLLGVDGQVSESADIPMIEETIKTVGIDFNQDGRMDIATSERFQPISLFEQLEDGRFQTVPAERLPCPIWGNISGFINGGLITLDYDQDGRTDLLLTRESQPLELWLNRHTPENVGKLFQAVNLRPAGTPPSYVLKEGLRPQGAPPAFFVSSLLKRRDAKGIALRDANNREIQDWALRRWTSPQNLGAPLIDAAVPFEGLNEGAGLSCLDHRTQTLRRCPPEVTQVRLGTANQISASIKVIETADINGDGNPDLLLGPIGWREVTDHLLDEPGAAQLLSPVTTLLLGNSPDMGTSTFRDASQEVRFNLQAGTQISLRNPADGIDRQVQQIYGILPRDFDSDQDVDLVIVDFTTVIYLENQGRGCWQAQANDPSLRCLIERTAEAFPRATHGFDGLYGMKNYGAESGFFNADPRPDFILRAAGEDIVLEQVNPQ
jgi:hypothetical protein